MKLKIQCSKCMHGPVTSQANVCTYCMHCPMTSQADACSYCMGSVLISSQIYPKTSKKYRLLKFCYVPATSAARNRLLFFLFLLRPFTVLMKQTRQVVRAIKLSIFFRCLCAHVCAGWFGINIPCLLQLVGF